MKLKKNPELGEKILRIGLGATIVWFGVSQLVNPGDWVGFLPGWAFGQEVISTTSLVYINGLFEALAGLLLIFGQFSRIVSILMVLHMALIIFHLGYNDIAVRDFGLLAGFLALVFMSENKSFLNKKKSK